MIDRIKGVLLLDKETFNEVAHDTGANGQATLVVIIASILAALGWAASSFFASLSMDLNPWRLELGSPIVAFIGVSFWSIMAWLIWAAAIYIVGAKIFSGKATFGAMVRVTGFAFAPLGFMILGVIPGIGFALSFALTLVVSVWTLAAVFVGMRECLDFDSGKTLVTALIGWLIYLIGTGIVVMVFAGLTLDFLN